jgi:membrane protease YdiL (CAAX protease family)
MSQIIHPDSPGLVRKIIAFPLTLLIIGSVAVIAAAVLVGRGWNWLDLTPNTPLNSLGAVLVAAAVIAAYKAYKRWIERAEDNELAFAGAPRELGAGLLLGAALFSAVTGVVALLGGFEVLGLRGTGQLWSMLALAVFSGTFEEVLFRGILFRHIETMLGSWAALALTSALFGAAHLGNADATWFSSFAIAVEAVIMLGAAFMLTRRLWLAIGIHAAWNFTQGWIFSIPVSGGDAPLGLLITRRVGPDWLTGGDFGLEASFVALAGATAFGLALLYRAVKQGEVKPPMWKRQTKL